MKSDFKPGGRTLCEAPWRIEIADSLPSTNTALKAAASGCGHGYTLAVREQTAGRGQRGNSWESAAGRNVTFSTLLRPKFISPARQFVISEAVALAIVGVLDRYLPVGDRVSIKWPNDIYVGDRKICGILIEHTLSSGAGISYSVVGAGVNVNQEQFLSDAPNPVSLFQLTGREEDTDGLLMELVEAIMTEFDAVDTTDEAQARRLHRRFMGRLWRHDGSFHPFRLPDGSEFKARIEGVAADGRLTLSDIEGRERRFYFKEVSFVL